MPTYDYRCNACGHTLERFHAPDEKVSRTCPQCRKRQLTRQIGAGAGVIFRGSGFYETDYRKPSYQSDAKKDTSSGESKKTESSKSSSKKDTPSPKKSGGSDS